MKTSTICIIAGIITVVLLIVAIVLYYVIGNNIATEVSTATTSAEAVKLESLSTLSETNIKDADGNIVEGFLEKFKNRASARGTLLPEAATVEHMRTTCKDCPMKALRDAQKANQ